MGEGKGQCAWRTGSIIRRGGTGRDRALGGVYLLSGEWDIATTLRYVFALLYNALRLGIKVVTSDSYRFEKTTITITYLIPLHFAETLHLYVNKSFSEIGAKTVISLQKYNCVTFLRFHSNML
jgi:hypothetical protein